MWHDKSVKIVGKENIHLALEERLSGMIEGVSRGNMELVEWNEESPPIRREHLGRVSFFPGDEVTFTIKFKRVQK